MAQGPLSRGRASPLTREDPRTGPGDLTMISWALAHGLASSPATARCSPPAPAGSGASDGAEGDGIVAARFVEDQPGGVEDLGLKLSGLGHSSIAELSSEALVIPDGFTRRLGG